MHILKNKGFVAVVVVMLASIVLAACGGAATPAPTQDIALLQTQAAQTVVADLTQNAPPPPTQPPLPTETAPPPGPTPDPNIPVAVIPAAAPGEPSAVANYNTTIYGGPGTDYVVYAAFLGGTTARVVGVSEDGQWWAISVPVAPTGSGWVSAAWVTVIGAEGVPVLPAPPVPPTAEMVPPGPNDPQATAIANVYVRSGPATNYPAYGIAPAGSTGRVIGVSEDGQWWVVRINPENVGAGYGWVMAQYTQASNVSGVQTIQNPDTHTSVPPAPPASGAPTATAIEYVNVRSGPGTNYRVLGVAAPGASAEVTGVSADGQWWQVAIPTQYSASGAGWVSASFVVTQNTGSVPVAEAPPAPPAIATTPPPPSGTGCQLVSQTPADGTSISVGLPFNTTWVLQNSGSASWDQTQVDVRYLGAVDNIQMHQGSDVYDLTTTVQPGNTYNFSVSMIAPFNAGTYGELWELVEGNQQICQFYVYITVP
ncbi:MAG: SH3 domain-containing protein [Anaerolineales bacterium]